MPGAALGDHAPEPVVVLIIINNADDQEVILLQPEAIGRISGGAPLHGDRAAGLLGRILAAGVILRKIRSKFRLKFFTPTYFLCVPSCGRLLLVHRKTNGFSGST